MNIVFWFLVVLALVVVWFCLSCTFKDIGDSALQLWNDAKDEMSDDDDDDFEENFENEGKENEENER